MVLASARVSSRHRYYIDYTMSGMQCIINGLIQDGKEGTADLYSQIPFFMRTRLYRGIDSRPWASVSEACDREDEGGKERANQMYQQVLSEMDEYIALAKLQHFADNGILMKNDRHSIVRNFGTDAPRFVREVASCLEKEKQLIFLHKESHCMESLDSQDESECLVYEDQELESLNSNLSNCQSEIMSTRRARENWKKAYSSNSPPSADNTDGAILQDDQAERINSITQHLELQLLNYECLQRDIEIHYQNAFRNLCHLCTSCSEMVKKLATEVREWNKAHADRSVKIGPEPNNIPLFHKFQRLGQVLHTVTSWFSNGFMEHLLEEERERSAKGAYPAVSQITNLGISFNQTVAELLKMSLVVTEQPKDVISIENKGSKDSPNYCTKKTQPFFTTFRILGADGFSDGVDISVMGIELISDKDYVKNVCSGKTYCAPAPVVGKNTKSCLEASLVDSNSQEERRFKLEVKNFIRDESNTVYKQFFRLWYRVKVQVKDVCTEELTTVSLPFTFNTGANQILEHKGARMLYFGAVQDIYHSGSLCPDPIPIDTVINILDKRILHLDDFNSKGRNKKKRCLSEHEKRFLASRLPASSEGTVTVQGFLKDKMKKVDGNEILSFSFYTWFSSVIHTLESMLGSAWSDGLIYGFCNTLEAKKVLMSKDIPWGTFLLRPSNSYVNNTSSAEASADMTLEIKMLKNNSTEYDSYNEQYEVNQVRLLYKEIRKHTIYGLLKIIENDDKKPIALFLLGQNGGGGSVKLLKGHGTKCSQVFDDGYKKVLRKIQKFSLQNNIQQSALSTDAVSDENDCDDHELNRRKRKYKRSQSSQGNGGGSTSSLQVMVTSSNGSSSGIPSSQYPMPMLNASVKQEAVSAGSSGVPSQGQGERSGFQDTTVPELMRTHSSSQNSQACQKTPPYTVIGNVLVDVSKINSAAIVAAQTNMNEGHYQQESSAMTYQDLPTLFCRPGLHCNPTSRPITVSLPSTPESLASNASTSQGNSPESESSNLNGIPLPTILKFASEQDPPTRSRNRSKRGGGIKKSLKTVLIQNLQQETSGPVTPHSQSPAVIVEQINTVDNYQFSSRHASDINDNDLEIEFPANLSLALSNICPSDYSDVQPIELSPADSGLWEETVISETESME